MEGALASATCLFKYLSLLFVPVCSGHTALCEAAVSNQDRSSPGTSEENICRICGYLTRGRKGCCHLLERSWEHNVLLQVCQVAFTTHTDLPPNVNPCKHSKVKGPRLCCSSHLTAGLLCRKQARALDVMVNVDCQLD